MAFNAQGVWTPEDDTVQRQLSGLLAKDNPLMAQARANSKLAMNRRGLINSSIAAGEGERAALSVALPIASQEAQQLAQKNLGSMDIGSREKIAAMNVAAHDREKSAALTAAMANVYGEQFRTIAAQHELPADARNAYLEHIKATNTVNMSLIEQLYGIDLDWGEAQA